MRTFSSCSIFIWMMFTLTACTGQAGKHSSGTNTNKEQLVGSGCDGCELMFEGMPKEIQSVDTSTGWQENGQKLLVTGTIFQPDGKTPAQDVIVYYWHTDNDGYYSYKPGMNEKARRHGHIRGWVKTGKDGRYNIYTIRPAPYPNDVLPAHIHLSIKEPAIANEYYTDEINFDDDKLLIPYLKKHPAENRGGSGIVRILLKGDMQIAVHDIILGLHIPNYPKRDTVTKQSGRAIGEDQPSFTPLHVYGPDKGSKACPVCKYGRYHGIIYFAGNDIQPDELKSWLIYLDNESIKRKGMLKVYFVFANDKESNLKRLETLGKELHLQTIALTTVPSFADKESDVYLNKINTAYANTIIIYKHRRIIDKYIDVEPTKEILASIVTTLDNTADLFELKEPAYVD